MYLHRRTILVDWSLLRMERDPAPLRNRGPNRNFSANALRANSKYNYFLVTHQISALLPTIRTVVAVKHTCLPSTSQSVAASTKSVNVLKGNVNPSLALRTGHFPGNLLDTTLLHRIEYNFADYLAQGPK